MTTLAIDDITPERILAAAEKASLRLMPGGYFERNHRFEFIGCCPVAALALEANPACPRTGVDAERTLRLLGISGPFISGLEDGFDGVDLPPDSSPECIAGHALGRATRVAAGIDAPGGAP